MSIIFSGDELVRVAIDIERRGIVFYDIMAQSTENVAAGKAFRYLADVERQHVQIFQDILTEINEYQISEREVEDHNAYFKSLIENAIFTDDTITSEMATNAESDTAALELGICAEKDSILFYYEILERMPQSVKATLDRIINEEKTHLRQLTELKKNIDSTK